MPQLFQVLRCYKCLVFQIHQTKKSNKWQCKMCGEKQSIKRHYGLGNGKECRLHVQRLNAIRGQVDEEKIRTLGSDDDLENCNDINEIQESIQIRTESNSKWSTYVEKEEILEDKSEPMYLENKEVYLELPKKKKTNTDLKASNKHLNIVAKESFENKSYIETLNVIDDNFKDNATVNTITTHFKSPPNTLKPKNEFHVQKQDEFLLNKKVNETSVVQKTSKWAQFVEDEDEFEPNEATLEVNISPCNAQQLFTLCDDNDLDTVLNL